MSKDFYIAGDQYAGGHRKNWMGRVQLGFVVAVDRLLGKAEVNLKDALTPLVVDISFPAFTLNGASSSWFRYLPTAGAAVLIAFTPAGKPEIVSYSPIDYKQLVQFKEDGQFREFRVIAPGEFDLRSSGGAGFYATETGDYITFAGPTQFTLSADGNDARGTAGLLGWSNTGGELRFGNVKRHWADGIAAEHEIPSGLFSEFTARLVNPILGITEKILFQVGDVFDLDATVPYLPALDPETRLPLRARLYLYDRLGLTKTSVEVSEFGDTTISISDLAQGLGLKLVGLANRLTVNFLTVMLQAVVDLSVRAGANISITAGANVSITAVGPISINGSQVSVGGGAQGLMQAGAIPVLIAHTHPDDGVIAPGLAELALHQTSILRAN